MTTLGWIQIVAVLAAFAALTRPVGAYLLRVLEPAIAGRTPIERALGPLERGIYRLIGVDPAEEQTWFEYSTALLVFSAVTTLFTYALLRLQAVLPLNPQRLPPVSEHLSFNTAASFATNANWQSYGGESTMSYLSQMVALGLHHFLSPAVGIAVAAVLVRGIARSERATVGNFWVDLTRQILYLFLPAAVLYALFLVAQGIPQNFLPYTVAHVTERATGAVPATQTIVQGPVASMIAIKMLGTNGGGYVNANAAHPFENPTQLSNFVQNVLLIVVCSGLTFYLGRMVRKREHGWAVWWAMFVILIAGVATCYWAEARGNPRLLALGVDPTLGNMEGKEVRFGTAASALFAAMTTATGCGAVNAMHDSFTPLGGLVALFNIQLGEVIFGSVGSGLYGMLVFVIVAIFVAGLMVGRTPDYLGKKLDAREIKFAMMSLLVMPLFTLGMSAVAALAGWGRAGLNNAGPHGLTEILYAFSSATGNNGSAFAGITANAPAYDVALGIAILVGRYFTLVPVLALAGSLARKKPVAETAGTLPVSGTTFVVLLVATVLIVGALTFFPALVLGPIVEQLMTTGSSQTF